MKERVLWQTKSEIEFLKGVIREFERKGDNEAVEYHKKLIEELKNRTVDESQFEYVDEF